MVICLVAFVVFGFLGIFSASYRRKAKLLFKCFTDTLRLKPCQMEYDKKIRAKLAVKASNKSMKLGRFIYKYFRVISWVFVILFFASLIWVSIIIYNYVAYGNCNGVDSTGFCIFNPDSGSPDIGPIDGTNNQQLNTGVSAVAQQYCVK